MCVAKSKQGNDKRILVKKRHYCAADRSNWSYVIMARIFCFELPLTITPSTRNMFFDAYRIHASLVGSRAMHAETLEFAAKKRY